ncbi:MAG: hypothetical protein COB59_11685 [Rhodospirillaceae bacterium]|nr:MAG: hypothetical protein COB59_11685 [Rhodospirillaceae bacterium]
MDNQGMPNIKIGNRVLVPSVIWMNYADLPGAPFWSNLDGKMANDVIMKYRELDPHSKLMEQYGGVISKILELRELNREFFFSDYASRYEKYEVKCAVFKAAVTPLKNLTDQDFELLKVWAVDDPNHEYMLYTDLLDIPEIGYKNKHEFLKAGIIETVTVGKRRMIKRSSVENYLRSLKQ